MATTLPKDFREYGDAYSLIELQEIFESRPLDARGGYRKQTALAYSTVTAEGVTWLLDHGADIEAEDQFSASPLVTRAAEGDLEIVDLLIKRGADPIRAGSRHTPLCAAAANHRVDVVALLLERGATLTETDPLGWTALDLAAIRCEPSKVERGLPVVRLLASRGGTLSEDARPYLCKAMTTLYRYQAAGNARIATVDAMTDLLEMFDIDLPARPRVLAGGEAITVTTSGWKKQFSELWGILVPGSGPAASVQGEVIRIAGRIGHEILDNGGANWDRDFAAMATAFSRHVRSGVPLSDDGLRAVDAALDQVRGGGISEQAVDTLTEQSVAWVLVNPERRPLDTPDYLR